MLLIATVIAYRSVVPKRPAAQMRIVVLPFQNLTGDPSQEFFADGMTEEMFSQLGAMDPKQLGVIARTPAVKYKNSGKGIDQIGMACWQQPTDDVGGDARLSTCE